VWALRTTALAEGTNRAARLIAEMDYLHDGIVLLNSRGQVVGMNLAARTLAGVTASSAESLRGVFPCLSGDDVSALVDPEGAQELERASRRGHGLYSLRFRSQPSADMTVVQVSDVTAVKTRQMRDRQLGQFQLVGRIARGVAHDFNNMLCSMSAHASLLDRSGTLREEDAAAVRTILEQSERGSNLARRLLRLTEVDVTGRPTHEVGHHAENAAELLRMVLPAAWEVETEVVGTYPAVPLDGSQLEQILVNLALEAVAGAGTPGTIHLRVSPGAWGRSQPSQVVLEVCTDPPGEVADGCDSQSVVEVHDGGVIESVVRSVLEGVDGSLEVLAHRDGRHFYRLRIPTLTAVRTRRAAETGLTPELISRMRDWRVLLARPRDVGHRALEQRLLAMGVQVESAADLMVVLGRMETSFSFHAMILDRRLLGDGAESLIRAMLKLQPQTGLVVVCDEPGLESEDWGDDVVFVAAEAGEDSVIRAMCKAVERAGNRREVATI
jgi:signal transduction histidine kinase